MKRFLFVAVFIATSVAAGMFLVNGKNNDTTAQLEPTSKKMSKAQRIEEALEWRYGLLADPETGVYDINMLYAAVDKANSLRNSNAKSSGLLDLSWELLGADNQGGRTRALIFDRNVPTTLWAGSVGGGLFKSVDNGNNWSRVEAYDGFFPIGSIAQASDGALYVGTGEGLGNPLSGSGNSLNSQSPGNGIYKSVDNGESWYLLPGTDAGNNPNLNPSGPMQGGCTWCGVNDIAVSPINDNLILACTESGLAISTIAGEDAGTWTFASGLGGQGQAIEITSDGLTAYAAFNGRVYRSIDAANNFLTGWALMPITGGRRADVAIAPSNENFVYASVTATNNCMTGLWRSTDAGDTWTLIQDGGAPFELDPFNQPTADFNTCEGQGWFDQTIIVNPANENLLYIGGITLYTWGAGYGFKRANIIDTEGGDAFNPRYIHADVHEIIFNPSDPTGNSMLIGSDGGVTLCLNANSGFPDNLTYIQKNKGYSTLQVYGMSAGAQGEVFCGTQDNGSQYIDGLGSSIQAAQRVSGGDGVYAEVSSLDPDILFSGSQFGNILRSVNRGISTNSFLDNNIDQASCSKITCSASQACTANSTSFIYPFYLLESSSVSNLDQTATLTARNDTLLLASGATQIIREELFPTFKRTTTISFSNEDPTPVETVVEEDVDSYTFSSRVSDDITFKSPISSVVMPGQTLSIDDPYDAKYFVASNCGVWMCMNPLQKNNEPVFYKVSTVSGAQTFDASGDGNFLYFSVSNRVYIIEGLNLIHQTANPNGCFNSSCLPNLRVQQIAILPSSGTIQGIGVDKNDPNTVLVTLAGFSNSSRVFRLENATDPNLNNINIVNLAATTATLPRMPVYDCIIDKENPNRYVLGTELGIWTSNDAGVTWSEDNTGMSGRMPVYRVRQKYMYDEDCMVVYAGTHGGGMFRTTTLTKGNCDLEPYQWDKRITGIKDVVANSIANISLFPNPVKTQGNLRFDLQQSAKVSLTVVDVTGRVVMKKEFGQLGTGTHELSFNSADLNNGSYHAVLTSNGKMMGSKLFLKR